MKIGRMLVVRNRTGKLHLGFEGSASTLCNHRGQSAPVRDMAEASAMEVATSSDGVFCKRCFPEDCWPGIPKVRAAANEILENEACEVLQRHASEH